VLLEGDQQLVEHDMPRSDHATSLRIVAAVGLVIRRVAQEHARDGAWAELVGSCCGLVGIAQAAKHTKMIIGGRCAEEELVGHDRASSLAGPPV
jgi:hypothetical protein